MRTTLTATLVAIALVAACSKSDADRQLDGRLKDEKMKAFSQMPSNRAQAGSAGMPVAAPQAVAADELSRDDAENAGEPGTPLPGHADATDSLVPSMIIRTGSAAVEVDSLEIAVQRVRDLAHRVGGYIANVQLQAGREQVRSATLEIRLPSARFDEVATGLRPIGHVESVNVSAEDVGEEYVDVAARVENAKREEARLIEILGTRTGKLRDVLDVEREIARVRESIERMEGRMRYLRTRASVSTFSITVHEPYPVVGQTGSGSVLGEAFKQSWRNFVRAIARGIAALGTLIPTVAVIVALAAGIIAMLKRMRPKA